MTFWTPSETGVVRAQWGTMSSYAIAALLPGRTAHGVSWKAREMGLPKIANAVSQKFRTDAWTPEQDVLLHEHYGKMRVKELAVLIGRNPQNVYVRAWQRRLTNKDAADKSYVKQIPQEAMALYLQGAYIEEVLAVAGMCKQVFYRRIRSSGIKRKVQPKHRICKCPKRRAELIAARAISTSAYMQGVTVSEWKGFSKPDKARQRHNLQESSEWKQWRKEVFRRDRGRCVMCKRGPREVEERIEPHHILRKHEHPHLVFEVGNGVTLCRPCHRSISRKEHLFVDRFRSHVVAMKQYWANQRAAV